MPVAPEDEVDTPESGEAGAAPTGRSSAAGHEAGRDGSPDADPVEGTAGDPGPAEAADAGEETSDTHGGEGISDAGDGTSAADAGEGTSDTDTREGTSDTDATDTDEEPTMPERIRWKPVFSPLAIGMGALADVGFEVVLHQLGLALLTTANVLYQVAEGAALGIIAPSLGSLLGAWWVNRKITKLEMEMADTGPAEATP